jgi:pimeloyl-ACP methyl ester carboxylesterase
VQDTKNLVNYFRANVAKPDRTILWGFSLGSVITFKSMEHFGGVYDGAIAACAVGAGATRTWDTAASLMLAYDVVFGVPSTWGSVGDVRDDIDFESTVQPKLFAEVSNPANFPKFEFIRLVGGNPGRGIQPPPPPFFYPFWAFTDFFFITEARAELERRAAGPVVQNLNHNYTLTPQEKAYLAAFGLPTAVTDAWLAQMNARTNISAPNHSRNYLERNADYSGKIKSPVLTLHTVIDGLVVSSQESAYRETVAAAGRSDRLFQVYTSGSQLGVVPGNIGHCDFTPQQLFASVAVIEGWVKTGVRPTAANFPPALGFVPNFTPPPFPQP